MFGVSIGFASMAQAGTCSQQSGAAKRDPNTGWSWTTWWICGNDSGAKMYRDANTSVLTGYMDSSSSWFVCYRHGAQHAGGNDVWYYSQGDRAASGQSGRQAWGFMPAVNVYTSTDPWPGMAACPSGSPENPPAPDPPLTRSDGANKPLILLHGIEVSGSVDCNSYWGSGSVVPYLNGRGWSGRVVKATYYSAGGNGCDVRIPGAAGTGRPIDDLGADFAWWVYNTYSSHGQPIDVIAHSMGGLVTRVAIAGVANHRTTFSGRSFPPYLYIEDVATLSTPHEGARWTGVAGCATVTSEQCAEMVPGSGFLGSWILRPAGQRVGYDNPQSTTIGTDWTALGSGDDWMVNTGSALNISATYHVGHKIIYLSGSGLDHGQMSNISGGSYALRYCDWNMSCDMTNWDNWPQTTSSPGPIAIAANAVYFSSSW